MKKIFTILFITTSFFCKSQSKTLVISEIYGGGGTLDGSYKNDYLQIFNLSSSPIDLSEYTVQIAPTSGNSWSVINLSGIIKANRWFLLKGEGEGSADADLPVADVTANFNINIESGKIALVNSHKTLTTSCIPFNETITDFVGYGNNADCSETSSAPGHSNTSATSRVNFASDADNNSKDFAVFPPNPRNTSETALPITLNIFTANKIDKANRIHWQVNCLSTSVTFELERSSTLQQFITIYTSTESKARCATPFDFNDSNPQNGTNYYRLKTIDIDGNISYSKIALSINSFREINRIKITPNIVSSIVELHYTSDKSEKIKLQISDLQGRIIKKLSLEVVAGDNKIIIPTNEFSKGQYYATIFLNGEKITSAKFVKQ